ncbi:unnamed protein product [Amoebophrya sp. A25]|nr:unnamed protein product [Amoebophrya sp. A25]|eukprot:GSA25T00024921001.1
MFLPRSRTPNRNNDQQRKQEQRGLDTRRGNGTTSQGQESRGSNHHNSPSSSSNGGGGGGGRSRAETPWGVLNQENQSPLATLWNKTVSVGASLSKKVLDAVVGGAASVNGAQAQHDADRRRREQEQLQQQQVVNRAAGPEQEHQHQYHLLPRNLHEQESTFSSSRPPGADTAEQGYDRPSRGETQHYQGHFPLYSSAASAEQRGFLRAEPYRRVGEQFHHPVRSSGAGRISPPPLSVVSSKHVMPFSVTHRPRAQGGSVASSSRASFATTSVHGAGAFDPTGSFTPGFVERLRQTKAGSRNARRNDPRRAVSSKLQVLEPRVSLPDQRGRKIASASKQAQYLVHEITTSDLKSKSSASRPVRKTGGKADTTSSRNKVPPSITCVDASYFEEREHLQLQEERSRAQFLLRKSTEIVKRMDHDQHVSHSQEVSVQESDNDVDMMISPNDPLAPRQKRRDARTLTKIRNGNYLSSTNLAEDGGHPSTGLINRAADTSNMMRSPGYLLSPEDGVSAVDPSAMLVATSEMSGGRAAATASRTGDIVVVTISDEDEWGNYFESGDSNAEVCSARAAQQRTAQLASEARRKAAAQAASLQRARSPTRRVVANTAKAETVYLVGASASSSSTTLASLHIPYQKVDGKTGQEESTPVQLELGETDHKDKGREKARITSTTRRTISITVSDAASASRSADAAAGKDLARSATSSGVKGGTRVSGKPVALSPKCVPRPPANEVIEIPDTSDEEEDKRAKQEVEAVSHKVDEEGRAEDDSTNQKRQLALETGMQDEEEESSIYSGALRPVLSDAQRGMADEMLAVYQSRPNGMEKIQGDDHWTKIDLRVNDMRTLAPRTWLNDNVIDFYIKIAVREILGTEVVDKKVLCWNTQWWMRISGEGQSPGGAQYCYANVKRWSLRRKADIFGLDLMIVPCGSGSHWSLGVVDFRRKRLIHICSLGLRKTLFMEVVRRYLSDEWKDKKKGAGEFSFDGWTELYSSDFEKELGIRIPRQDNSDDCGMFTIAFAVQLAQQYRDRGAEKGPSFRFGVSPDLIHDLRRRYLLEIRTGEYWGDDIYDKKETTPTTS